MQEEHGMTGANQHGKAYELMKNLAAQNGKQTAKWINKFHLQLLRANNNPDTAIEFKAANTAIVVSANVQRGQNNLTSVLDKALYDWVFFVVGFEPLSNWLRTH